MAKGEASDETSVLLASNALAQREGMGQFIELADGLKTIRSCTLDDAIRFSRGLKPDVSVLCFSMSDELDFQMIVELTRGTAEAAKVVVFAYALSAFLIQSSVRAGASGCVSGDADGMSSLVEAIRAAADGRSYISQGAASLLAADDGQELTEREIAVCRLIALGYSTREAAEELGLSTRTVESYRSQLNTKLELGNRRDLVAYALKNGLIP